MSPGDLTRASDSERSAVVEQLQAAHVDGRLDSDELAQRVEAALRARTRGDLAAVTADLPSAAAASATVAVPQPDLPARSGPSRQALDAWRAWGIGSGVTFVVWLITAVTAGELLYPWFLWVAGPWGVVLVVKTLTGGFHDED